MIPPLATKIVQIDADPLEIGRSYPDTIGVVGDAKATLTALRVAVLRAHFGDVLPRLGRELFEAFLDVLVGDLQPELA